MSSRETILQRIRQHLASAGGFREEFALAAPPPAPAVWPRLNPDAGAMAERFALELQQVHGEVARLRAMEEVQRQLPALLAQENWPTLGAVDSPAARAATALVPAEQLRWVDDAWTPPQIAALSAGLVVPELLLADTGSSLVACATANQRLMCYLPPVCIVVARCGQLVEHLPAAWETVAGRCGDPSLRGEFVIITGPSRTADIEKILILGVHGPKRLIVLLAD
jgi:L-lactate dehydrogenase complex protein LldG